MKHLLACLLAPLLLAADLAAHGHVEVGVDSSDPTRLALAGTANTLAVYVPRGEPFSGYLPRFPGGAFATELTFSCEGAASPFPDGSLPRVELLSVTGPAGGAFSFWEVNATAPTWTRPTGWSGLPSERPSIIVYEDGTGYGHIHGRVFTANEPGSYTLTFRALDDEGVRSPSAPFVVTLEAQAAPALALQIAGTAYRVSFVGRSGFTYDLQTSTDLQSWINHPVHVGIAGNGETLQLDDPIADRPRVFYRLVEYF
jgi:hypothetical protein